MHFNIATYRPPVLIQCACVGAAGEVSERENLCRFICIVKLLSINELNTNFIIKGLFSLLSMLTKFGLVRQSEFFQFPGNKTIFLGLKNDYIYMYLLSVCLSVCEGAHVPQ